MSVSATTSEVTKEVAKVIERALYRYPDNRVVPMSPLDNVFYCKSSNPPVIRLYSPLDGSPLDVKELIPKLRNNIVKKLYPGTDHAILVIRIPFKDDTYVSFIYVSLDNSVRANTMGHAVKNRLSQICSLVRSVLFLENTVHKIIFFSEACRPSFDGNREHKINLVTWKEIIQTMEKEVPMKWLAEKTYNDDPTGMAMGLAAFYSSSDKDSFIKQVHMHRLWTEKTGSVTIGIELTTGQIIWGVHFPLDFQSVGSTNPAHTTMLNLQKLMKEHVNTVCAFGDFNLVPGTIRDAIASAVSEDFQFAVGPEQLTFFGSYFDTVADPEHMFQDYELNSL